LPVKRDDVAAVAIPALSAIERMSVQRTPVTAASPRSQAARYYRDLWHEALTRSRLDQAATTAAGNRAS
jgi:hypothetical protein